MGGKEIQIMEQANVAQYDSNSVELIREEILIDKVVEEAKIAVPDPQVKVGYRSFKGPIP